MMLGRLARRQALRRTLAIARPDRDENYTKFPREREGLDYALNWSLNGDGVTPRAEAFRITKASYAAKLAGGSVAAINGSGYAAEQVDEDAFDAGLDACVAVLESAPNLYVAEGDVPERRLPCRVITDDVAIATTAMVHALERMPRREPTELPLTCYVSPNAPAFAAFDIFQEDDADKAKVVLTGTQATAANLKASILYAAQKLEEPPAPPQGEA